MRFSRKVSGLIAGAALLATSCVGASNNWNATRSLLHWNQTVSSNKWAQEGIFIGLNIIPVYGLWVIGDALIFNSIDFWGGKNPIDPPPMVTVPKMGQLDDTMLPPAVADLADVTPVASG